MHKKKINILKGILATVMALGVFIGKFPTVEAAETTDSIIVEDAKDSTIEFINESGEVIAVFTPYSETNPAPNSLARSTSVDVNVSLSAYKQGYLSTRYNLNVGDQIGLNITISPNAQSAVGLYEPSTNSFSYPDGTVSSTGWTGTLTIGKTGSYSLAFFNQSAVTATYKGTYTLP